MAKWHVYQNSFRAGELSPEFAAQLDSQFTRSGLAEAVNVVLLRSGAIAKAPGSRFVSYTTAQNITEGARIWGFLDPDTNEWLLATFIEDKVYVSDQVAVAEPPDGVSWFSVGELSGDVAPNGEFDNIVSEAGATGATLGFAADWRANRVNGGQYTPNALTGSYRVAYSSYPRAVAPDLGSSLWALYGRPFENTFSLYSRVYPIDPAGRGNADQWDTVIDLDGLFIRTNGTPPVAGAETDDLGNLVPRAVFDFEAPSDIESVAVRLRLRRPLYNTSAIGVENPDVTPLPESMWGIRVRVAIAANEFTGTALLDETILDFSALDYGDDDTFVLSTNVPLGTVSPGDALVCSIGLVTTGVDAYLKGTPATEGSSTGYYAHMHVEQAEVFMSGEGAPLNLAEVTTGYTAAQVEQLHFIQSPFDDKELICLTPGVAPKKLYRSGSAWAFGTYTFTSPPATWSGASQPDVATDYQGRLVLSGASGAPETVFASKAGAWSVFTAGTAADDPVVFTPTARGNNTWVAATRTLLFGNTVSEYSVTAQSGAIQPGDVAVNPQTPYGSLRMPQKLALGPTIAVPTAAARELRLLQYTDGSGGFVMTDVSSHAEHLLTRRVKRMAFVRDPQESLWCVMADGSVLVMSLEGGDTPPGWVQRNFNGDVLDITTVFTPEGDTIVVLLVRRPDGNGNERIYLEVVNNLRQRADWRYTDATLEVANTSAGTSVGGFEHLNGQQVSVFEDGVYTGEQVVSAGEVSVQPGVLRVRVGIPYTFRLRTLPQNSIDAVRAGGLAAKKRFASLGVRALDSGPPIINGNRPPERAAASPMDTTPTYSGVQDYEVATAGWDTQGSVVVEEPQPFGLTVLAVYGKLSHNDI